MLHSGNMKMKPLYKRIFCNHQYTGGIRRVTDNKGRIRYAHICIKCGQRYYTN